MEMHLILQAGMAASEGFALLAEAEKDGQAKAVLLSLDERIEEGAALSDAFRQSGAFPHYMVSMIEIGESTGYLDSVFKALSLYYERQAAISRTVKSAVVYPAILFIMMLAVIAVLVIQVLPIFSDVFAQLGAVMSPLATAFLNFGLALRRSRYLLLILLGTVAALCLAVFLVPSWRSAAGRLRSRLVSRTKLGLLVGRARFASAMSMTMSSGLDVDTSMEMAESLTRDSAISERINACRRLVLEGAPFAEAVARTELFEPIYCRMLSIGMKTGAADTVMEEIARRAEENVSAGIERAIGKVEPALVIVMSLLVGLVLLSVMLPLMGIMSSIG